MNEVGYIVGGSVIVGWANEADDFVSKAVSVGLCRRWRHSFIHGESVQAVHLESSVKLLPARFI